MRSKTIHVSKNANDMCRRLHRGLDSQRYVYGPLVEAFGNGLVERR